MVQSSNQKYCTILVISFCLILYVVVVGYNFRFSETGHIAPSYIREKAPIFQRDNHSISQKKSKNMIGTGKFVHFKDMNWTRMEKYVSKHKPALKTEIALALSFFQDFYVNKTTVKLEAQQSLVTNKRLRNSSKAQKTEKELSFLSLKIDCCQHMSWIDRLEVCQHHLNWEERNLNKSKRTSVKHSLVKVFLGDSAGIPNMLYIKTYTLDNNVKTLGGDYFRSFLIEKSKNIKVNINLFDFNNGEYSGVFQIPKPGNYELQITLEYSVCEGMTDPPSNWFTKGTKFISQPPLL